MHVATGTNVDGRRHRAAPLGADGVLAGVLNGHLVEQPGQVVTRGPIQSGGRFVTVYDFGPFDPFDFFDDNEYVDLPALNVHSSELPVLYALSPVFEIVGQPPSIADVSATQDRIADVEVSWELDDSGSDLTALKVQHQELPDKTWKDAQDFSSEIVIEELTGPGTTTTVTVTVPPFAARSWLFPHAPWRKVRNYRVVAQNAFGSATSTPVLGVNTGRKLTAEFVEVPVSHGGEDSRITVRIEFNRSPGVEDLCAVLFMTNSNDDCGSTRIGGDLLWEVTWTVKNNKAVTIEILIPECIRAKGQVCYFPTVTVQAPIEQAQFQEPLTAAFVAHSMPDEHGGAGTTFTARIEFSEAIAATGLCAALDVTSGSCRSSSALGGAGLWQIEVAPDGGDDVSLGLDSPADCAAADAVCTADGRALTGAIGALVGGPPVIPLTAGFVGERAPHGGAETTFAVRIRFSEDIEADDLCASVGVGNGSCASSATVDGRADLWQIEVAPDGAAAVTVSLAATSDCAAAGAVCTADGRPLSSSIATSLPRRALTVAWVADTVPAAHEGAGQVFTVRVEFSEPVATSYRVLRDQALNVTDGTGKRFKRVGGSSALWEVHVEPASSAAVRLSLAATADCAADAAVCTADGAPQSNGLELTVPGPQ